MSAVDTAQYAKFLAGIKSRELILLYWDIGAGIVEKQKKLSWVWRQAVAQQSHWRCGIQAECRIARRTKRQTADGTAA